MSTQAHDLLQRRIEELRPWRYNHAKDGIEIKSDVERSAHIFDTYGAEVMRQICAALFDDTDRRRFRAIDLGCLEGHYSEILCALGFGEVVAMDLSEAHVKRADFLLKELNGFPSARIVQGNVADEALMQSLGKFNLVLFHGLLYHLQDPLRVFDLLEHLAESDPFYLLLSTQYRSPFDVLVASTPLAHLRAKKLPDLKGSQERLVGNAADGSVFAACSLELNPAAVQTVLVHYGYRTVVAYDDPGGTDHRRRSSASYHSNLVATKAWIPDLAERLNRQVSVPGVRFYDWDGRSVNSYHFDRHWKATAHRLLAGVISRVRQALR